jgi:hypothetical protein
MHTLEERIVSAEDQDQIRSLLQKQGYSDIAGLGPSPSGDTLQASAKNYQRTDRYGGSIENRARRKRSGRGQVRPSRRSAAVPNMAVGCSCDQAPSLSKAFASLISLPQASIMAA